MCCIMLLNCTWKLIYRLRSTLCHVKRSFQKTYSYLFLNLHPFPSCDDTLSLQRVLLPDGSRCSGCRWLFRGIKDSPGLVWGWWGRGSRRGGAFWGLHFTRHVRVIKVIRHTERGIVEGAKFLPETNQTHHERIWDEVQYCVFTSVST